MLITLSTPQSSSNFFNLDLNFFLFLYSNKHSMADANSFMNSDEFSSSIRNNCKVSVSNVFC